MEADYEGDLAARITRIEHRIDIRNLLDRYALAATKRDWDGVASCYAPEATFREHPPVELWMKSRAEIVDTAARLMGAMHSVVMMMHSCVIELSGDTATAETILHESGRTVQDEDFFIVGRYRDRIVRSSGTWLFAEREFYAIQWRLPPSFPIQQR